jgi:hypothetical protein
MAAGVLEAISNAVRVCRAWASIDEWLGDESSAIDVLCCCDWSLSATLLRNVLITPVRAVNELSYVLSP